MKLKHPSPTSLPSLPRRQFVQGLALGGVMLGARSVLAGVGEGQPQAVPQLSGTEFELNIIEAPVNFTGKRRLATTINGSIPAPTLHWREGDTVTIRVTNHLRESTSIHWHGLILPWDMDGVPGISFRGIAPGETFTYRFKLQQSGTYWYHSHSGFQEMTGMYGAIIIAPRGGERIQADRDYVMQLSDWSDEDPWRIYEKLKTQSDYYNFNQPTLMGLYRDVRSNGLRNAIEKRRMWNEMRMNPTDLSDLSAHTLTFLMNGTTPAGNQTNIFSPGERVRLRFINSASNTFYDVRIPNLKMTVVQADGLDIEPVTVDEFRFGSGETYDVIVEPQEEAYTIFAEALERSGFARATLSSRPGLSAAIPELREPDWLGMVDMMGSMDNSLMAEMDAMEGMEKTASAQMAMEHGQTDHGLAIPSAEVRHATSEYGPSTDMRVDTPRTNHDDPGIGLRNSGRRVLTLADLRSLNGLLDTRQPEREIELHLTGNMERYSWSMDGVEYGQSTPVHFNKGERLRVIMHNDTMMMHPMHLHGMWSDLENDQGEFMVRKHTIVVQPAQRVSFLVSADALGRWAWHCHLLFHMDAGMFRQVIVT